MRRRGHAKGIGLAEDRVEERTSSLSALSGPFAAMVQATRMPMCVTDPNQPGNPIVFSNDAFTRLTGYRPDEVLGRNCDFLQGRETDPAAIQAIRVALDRRDQIEVDLVNYTKAGERFWNRLQVAPVVDDEGRLTHFFASQYDVTVEKEHLVQLRQDRDDLEREVVRRTAALDRSEARLGFIVEAARFGMWTIDLTKMRLSASDVCKENFGRDPAEPFTYEELLAAVDPEDRERMERAMRECIDARTDYDVEFAIQTPDGQRRWLNSRGRTSYDHDGMPVTVAGMIMDVTDRRLGEEHRAMLAAELDHRVKNSMANIQAIAHQTLRGAATLDDARETLDARLRSLARAHDVLTGGVRIDASMAEVVDKALEPFRDSEARFSVGGPEVSLPQRLALAFVLALHELSTNAVKYGALSNATGRVSVAWEVGPGPVLRFRWEESGGPVVAPPNRKGFGSKLIERALASELAGTATIDCRPAGIVFRVDALLPVVDSQAPRKAGPPNSGTRSTEPSVT